MDPCLGGIDPSAERLRVRALRAAPPALAARGERHTFASLLIAAGNHAKAVSVMMGHAHIAITFDTYGRLMPGSHDEVAAQTNASLERMTAVTA